MVNFTDDFVNFFNDLTLNNNKNWFHENKKRYEASIKKPFENFLRDLISEIQKYDTELILEPKDCVARINRDIRFSKDKTPYNLHSTAFISRGGKKDKSFPGIYLRFSAQEVGIMGGCFGPSKEQLNNIRHSISSNLDQFQKLISDKKFVSTFGKVVGEEHKRIPAEFKETYNKEPLIAKKQFYYVATKDVSILTKNTLLPTIMEHWHVARPINEFLTKAM